MPPSCSEPKYTETVDEKFAPLMNNVVRAASVDAAWIDGAGCLLPPLPCAARGAIDSANSEHAAANPTNVRVTRFMFPPHRGLSRSRNESWTVSESRRNKNPQMEISILSVVRPVKSVGNREFTRNDRARARQQAKTREVADEGEDADKDRELHEVERRAARQRL